MTRRGGPKLLSIIVPVYKQGKTIESNIRDLLQVLKQLHIPFEIVIVVDGIVDDTFSKAKRLKSKYIKVTGYKTNHGKGYAVRFGMSKSRGDIVGFIDAGGDVSASGISMMLAHMQWYNADIIVGSKLHPVSKVQYPWQRRILSLGYQLIIRILFGLSVKDSQVGLKLYKRGVLEDVFPRLLVKQFAFDIEMLAVSYYLGYRRIFEAPVELDFSGASSITSKNFWRVILRTLWDTAAVFYRLRILKYYDNTSKRKWRYDPELNFRINVG